MAFRNILGYFPTYMRPPYSECNDTCSEILGNLGYHVTYFDLDTAGYINSSPTLIVNSKIIWDNAISNSNNNTDSILEIEHDIQYQTVYNLTDYILASMYKHGYKSVALGDCLGDPAENWYRYDTAHGPVPPTSQSVSADGTCSATITCLGSNFGNCCSQYGYCGSTADYCGTDCQPASGTCEVPLSNSSTLSSTSSSKLTKMSSLTKSTPTTKVSLTKSPSSTKVSLTKSSTSKSTPLPSPTVQGISTDGSCGKLITCRGSTFGNCCSSYGWCGSTAAYCGTGCQPNFGIC